MYFVFPDKSSAIRLSDICGTVKILVQAFFWFLGSLIDDVFLVDVVRVIIHHVSNLQPVNISRFISLLISNLQCLLFIFLS
ncbi:hypothetical protein [secondary endosymbiont of Heteropsylla cubana]|nr:hypothetical protein [secondary endosymbiont of Heteropsylla cubana]